MGIYVKAVSEPRASQDGGTTTDGERVVLCGSKGGAG